MSIEPFEISIKLSQLEKLCNEVNNGSNLQNIESYHHIWVEIGSNKLSINEPKDIKENTWKKINLDSNKLIKYFNILKKTIQGDRDIHLKFDGKNLLLKINLPDKENSILNDCISFFGDEYANQLSIASDNKRLPQETFLIAKSLLEGIHPLKDYQIVKIFELLNKLDLKNTPIEAGEVDVCKIYSLLNDSIQAIRLDPSHGMIPLSDEEGAGKGINTTYFLTNLQGEKLWVFKPEESEMHTLDGIPKKGGAKREQVAYLVNENKYPIPFTTYIEVNNQIGSAQLFIKNCIPLSEMRMKMRNEINKINSRDLQFIMLYDLYFSNCDGHMSNILCRPNKKEENITGFEIFSIDHGGSMTNSLKDPLFLDYLHLKQLCFTSFNKEIIDFIKTRDTKNPCEILEKHGIKGEVVDWHNFVHNCLLHTVSLLEQGKEILPAEIAWILVKERDLLMTRDDKDLIFKKMVSDVLNVKAKLNILLNTKSLNQKSFQITMGLMQNDAVKNYCQQIANNWINVLFKNIAKNYCRELSDDASFREFLSDL